MNSERFQVKTPPVVDSVSGATTETQTHRVIYTDMLRMVATAAVVALHVSSQLAYQFNSIGLRRWWLGNFIDSATRWCVPIFIMISGFLLLNPNKIESLLSFLRKRFFRVFIPFIVWSLLYSVWKIKDNLQAFSLPSALLQILQGPVYYHLGFLYILIGLYLVTPIIRVYVARASQQNLVYFISLWYLFGCIIPILRQFAHINVALEPTIVLGYVGYYILGYYLATTEIRMSSRIVIYLLALISLAITTYGTYILTIRNSGNLDEFFYGYLTPNVVLMSTAVFVLIKQINWEKALFTRPLLKRTIGIASNCSFGIYLIHPMVLEMLSKVKIDASFIHPIVGIPLTISIILLISLIVIYTIRRIPVIKFMS